VCVCVCVYARARARTHTHTHTHTHTQYVPRKLISTMFDTACYKVQSKRLYKFILFDRQHISVYTGTRIWRSIKRSFNQRLSIECYFANWNVLTQRSKKTWNVNPLFTIDKFEYENDVSIHWEYRYLFLIHIHTQIISIYYNDGM